MNDLVPAQFGQISNKFANVPVNDDLSSGVQMSFGMIGYKGKVWSVRFRGEEQLLMRDDGDGARGSIEVVIIKAATVVSKIWYEEGYVEGSTAPPDCYSNNGVRPEAASTKPQCETCAVCPRNQWGSRITPAGKQGKDCSDSKRLAVVPLEDLQNEVFGGPMLLRVPAASLQDMSNYGQKMQQLGYPYFAIGTRIQFDVNEAYPKFLFNAIRPIDDEEADIILAHQESHIVQRILSESEFTSGIAGPEAATAHHQPVFEQPAPASKPNGKASVGDQARAAAAQTKAAATKTGFGATASTTAAPAAGPAKTKAAPKKTAAPELTHEEKVLAAAQKALAEAQAKAEAAKAAAAAATEQSSEEEQEEEDNGAVATDFDNTLDELLSGLLPQTS